MLNFMGCNKFHEKIVNLTNLKILLDTSGLQELQHALQLLQPRMHEEMGEFLGDGKAADYGRRVR